MTPPPTDWPALAWPAARLGEALVHFAHRPVSRHAKLNLPAPPSHFQPHTFERWLQEAAELLSLEIEAVTAAYEDLSDVLRHASPVLLHLATLHHSPAAPAYLIILKSDARRLTLLTPDLKQQPIALKAVQEVWGNAVAQTIVAPLDQFLSGLGVSLSHQAAARRAIAARALRGTPVAGCWLIQHPPAQGLWKQFRRGRVISPSLVLLGASLGQQVTQIGTWAIIGESALTGRFEWAWLLGWALTLYTGVLFQAITYNVQGPFAMGLLRFFKEQLLYGALHLDSESVRSQGSGQFFGRVLESDIVQSFLLGGALIALPFVVNLSLALVVLALGVAGWLQVTFLLLWIGLAAYWGWRRFQHGDAGMALYRAMTNDLVERMRGHRTRLAQESRQLWHAEEDHALADYLAESRQFDWNGVRLEALVPRGWLVLGLSGLAYAFVFQSATTTEKLAISLGGVLLAYQAFTSLADSLKFIAQAAMSWRQIVPLLEAAQRATLTPTLAIPPTEQDTTPPVLLARDLVFRYHDRGEAILQECSLTIREGERYLLEGPSGGGKSTLATVLSGLRLPESGLLLLRGLDPQTVGPRVWRQRIVMALQFQENYLFSETFGFNLLLGRAWPPAPDDWREAETICRELGLGPLLERMPKGFDEPIGENGWQLSQGESSRLYIARALLQKADLVILDESFGTLDPESLNRAIRCVLQRARTLVVIAHP